MFIRSICFSLVALLFAPIVTAEQKNVDPFEGVNRKIFYFNDSLDRTLLKPVSYGYRHAAPKPVRKGLRNFFSNLGEIKTIANGLLQGKLKQAGSDTGRLLINSTVGIFGFFDVATKIGLDKHNEDFGQTLGKWNVPNGPYIVLPVLGPSTLRDASGRITDSFVDPMTYRPADQATNLSVRAVDGIDTREALLDLEGVVTGDRYIAIRELYLQTRNYQTEDGNVEDDFISDDISEDGFDDEFLDEEF